MQLLVCVTGGIAAYKACEICSLAIKAGHSVRVAMTNNAKRFVGPLTFEGLTGHAVMTESFSDAMAHIHWAKWADVVLVAPLTANSLSKLALGFADDAVSTLTLAVPVTTPIIVAPAMNTHMWDNPVVQRNLKWLVDLERFTVIEPVNKRLACGDHGVGALAQPEALLTACQEALVATSSSP